MHSLESEFCLSRYYTGLCYLKSDVNLVGDALCFELKEIKQMKHRESVYPISRVSCPVLRGWHLCANACIYRAVVCFNCLLRRLTPPRFTYVNHFINSSRITLSRCFLTPARLPSRTVEAVAGFFSDACGTPCRSPGLLCAGALTSRVGLCQRRRGDNRPAPYRGLVLAIHLFVRGQRASARLPTRNQTDNDL